MTFTAQDDSILANNLDVVIIDDSSGTYINHVRSVAPNIQALTYSNIGNLYGDLILDWLQYADQNGVSREAAFFHAASPYSYAASGQSNRPVQDFWQVFRLVSGSASNQYTRANDGTGLSFGPGVNDAVQFAYPDPFAQIRFTLTTPAAAGYSAVLEYPSAVDANGNPTSWKPIPIKTDGTAGFTTSGTITFDPPADWKPSLGGVSGGRYEYWVRIRTTSTGTTPFAQFILAQDYAGAGETQTGTIPVFDYAADTNHDGYLNDTEYAQALAIGDTARFAYQSRMPSGYGTMRWVTNFDDPAATAWAVSYCQRLMLANPQYNGIFMDNSYAQVPFSPGVTLAGFRQ
jgi:hypothetical protein